ncbi:hypothetical protein [Tenacibaculum sp. M341]|uniref:hypothetical protein n=1 Tax=Tenacibaculum sp. M341 TaxID=2530339 RepID=UPI00104D14F0|nr:hypothetical protein [Tenacibaculum sp. M341]TCI94891.1 hypothetical protein EYW44_00795 [Tenacibaculum sp. M341]
MLQNILKLNGVQELNSSNLKTVKGGAQFPYECTYKGETFDSSIDVSGDGVTCKSTTESEQYYDFGTPRPGHDVMMF